MSTTTDPPITAKMQRGLEDTKKTSAALRTFGIVELLERILQNLDIKDLVTVTRVCEDWRDLVDSSPTLSETTFKRAAPITEVLYSEAPYGPWKLTKDVSKAEIGFYNLARFHPLVFSSTVQSIPRWRLKLDEAQQLVQDKSLEQVYITQPPCKSWLITSGIFDTFESMSSRRLAWKWVLINRNTLSSSSRLWGFGTRES